jgi:hypothetical protein
MRLAERRVGSIENGKTKPSLWREAMKYAGFAGLAFAALFMLMASVPQASARVCGAAAGPNGAVAACTSHVHRYHRPYHRRAVGVIVR